MIRTKSDWAPALLLVLTLTTATQAQSTLCGDCNGDTVLSILDALVAAQHAASLIVLAGDGFTRCNVLGLLEPTVGAMVDILDALTLAQAAAGLPVALVCATPPPAGNPPVVTILAPLAGTLASPITILFDATDLDGDPLDLMLEFSTDSGITYQLATSNGAGSITTNPAFGVPPASALSFRWDASADSIGVAGAAPVTFRVAADDGMSAAFDTTTFTVNSVPPPPPACPQVAPPSGAPLNCNCDQNFPPVASVPCPIAESSTRTYVSATSGSDSNPGTTPAAPWRSLCHGISNTPIGGTLLVAEGDYFDADITVDTNIVVKGGFDASFSVWNPDLFHTNAYGRLTLDHPEGVFGGFRLITEASITTNVYWHNLTQGTFIRNYVQAVFSSVGGSHAVYFLVMRTPTGGTINLRCNDIYVRNEQSGGTFRAVRFYVFSGFAEVTDNRICAERLASGSVYTVAGYGPCTASPASITMTNNSIECATAGQYAMSFYGCGDSTLDFILTNNTILSRGRGISGYGGSSGTNQLNWRLTNNVVFSPAGGSSAIDVATSGAAQVQIISAENNLTFGYSNNGIFPTPIFAASNDTSGTSTPASVFTAFATGNLHTRATGAAADTGLNVHSQPTYGTVTADLEQLPRPVTGPWDRGALQR